MASEPLVEVDGVTKRFGGQTAIADLNLRVLGGHVTGLVGPDGAGKSTLLRLIAALLLPDDGSITVCGFDTKTGVNGIRQVVSYMPQRFGLYEDLSVQENLDLYADLRGIVGVERQRAFERLLAFTNLRPFTDRLAGKLSGGMKQKLGLACALINTPRLLLLDEPSAGVDPISRRELWRMVYELVDQGIGVIWSTAYLDEAERCASVVLLNKGQALYDGPPKELTERVTGRTFLVQNLGPARRKFLAQALQRPEVIDGVIQGSSIRLVVNRTDIAPDDLTFGNPAAQVVATPPRFEDAFVDLLGGTPKGESPLAAAPPPPNEGPEEVVEARELTKRFGQFVAANHISFSVRRGEIFGLLGPNGAGKSTTFRMMCGLLKPTSGTARVAGYDLHRAGGAARRRLGYMAQKFSLYGDLSVRENLDFFSGAYGLSGATRRTAVNRMVEAFDLQRYLHSNAGAMPLGFKQRLALACAVMHDPAVLFLDEPTSGVDPLMRREFWTHINAVVEHGVTVLVTTHFLDEAEYCDRIALVYQGHVIAEGSPDDLKDAIRGDDRPDPTLEDAFIELVENYDRRKEAS